MKANQIEVGKCYKIRHHGEIGLSTVMVDRVEKNYFGRVQYVCTKLSTGRPIRVRSAAKFRRAVDLELDHTLPKRARDYDPNHPHHGR